MPPRQRGGIHGRQWAQFERGGGAALEEAATHVGEHAGSDGAVSDRDEQPLRDRAARQVVQQPQAGVVGVVRVVDHQDRSGARGGQPEQLGRGDEQPLVRTLTVPAELPARQRPLDLVAEGVVEPVQQSRMVAAQVGERVEDRRVRPVAFDHRGSAHADPHAPRARLGLDAREQRGLARPGNAGDVQRASASLAGGIQQPADGGALAVPSHERHSDRTTDRRRAVDGQQLVAKTQGALARRDAQLPPQAAFQALELAHGRAPVAGSGQPPDQCEVGVLVARVGGGEDFPPFRQPQHLQVLQP